MSLVLNPVVSNLVLVPIDGTADQPSIRFGGDLAGHEGTGMYGDFDSMGMSIAGSEIMSISASGLSISGSISSSSISLGNDVVIITKAGAPVDGTTGLNVAGIGSLCSDRTNGKLYINQAAKSNPTWVLVGPV